MPEITLGTLKLHNERLADILAELNDNFPPINPHPDNPINLIMYRSGQRSVVEWLTSKLEED